MDIASPTAQLARLVFDPSWRSFSAIQGGLVVGHLLEAAAAHAGAPPRAVTAHLLGGVAPDEPVRLATSSDRDGRTGSVRSEMWQDGGLRAVAQVLTLARPASPVVEPYLPVGGYRPEDGVPLELPRDYVPIAEHTEIRALGPSRPLAGGPEPRLHAWVRMRGGLAPLVQLGVLLDALPPSLFAVRTVPAAMPTVELTAHLVGEPPQTGAWVRVDQRTVWADSDVAVDDVELRAVDGSLVARGRQTRRLPPA